MKSGRERAGAESGRVQFTEGWFSSSSAQLSPAGTKEAPLVSVEFSTLTATVVPSRQLPVSYHIKLNRMKSAKFGAQDNYKGLSSRRTVLEKWFGVETKRIWFRWRIISVKRRICCVLKSSSVQWLFSLHSVIVDCVFADYIRNKSSK